MAKFGKIISSSTPTLIIFHLVNPSDDLVLDIANALGDKARVIKIDADKNIIYNFVNSNPFLLKKSKTLGKVYSNFLYAFLLS